MYPEVKEDEMEEYEMLSCVRGYHIYYSIWDSCVGEMLHCESDRHNLHDWFAISIKRDDIIVGHLSWKISWMCTLFLRRGGNIRCLVSGGRRYSWDLPYGGVEIPCKLLFHGKPKEIKKLVKLINHYQWRCYVHSIVTVMLHDNVLT